MTNLLETNLPPDSSPGQIGYLGPLGTYSEEVILFLYRGQGETRKFVPFKSINAAIKAAAAGQVGESMVPIENSLEGSVNITLDTLAHEVDLPIIKEVVWPISHHLLAKGNNQTIGEIISHPQALAQCRRYLEKNYPRARLVEVDSTSEAVYLAAGGKKNAAAIGSARAGKIYNLDTLASHIEDDKNNSTRFVAVGKHPSVIPCGSPAKTSIVCQAESNRPGSLCAILEEVARRGVNLTHIESRPARTGLGQYIFFLDMEGSLAEANVREAVEAVRKQSVMFKNLGSYPIIQLSLTKEADK